MLPEVTQDGMKLDDFFIDCVIKSAPVEKRLRGLSVEERLAGISTEDLVKYVFTPEYANSLTPEARESFWSLFMSSRPAD